MSEIRDGLQTLLADYQVLYHKLRGFHWTVSGELFFGLHAKFEEYYNDAALKADEVAERILAVGGMPHTGIRGVLERARVQEAAGSPDAKAMVRAIVADFGALVQNQRELSGVAAGKGDAATANLLDGFADGQEKEIWMLRAFLGEAPAG